MPLSALRLPVTCLLATAGLSLIVATLPHLPLATVRASAKADRAAGQALFHDKGCEHCHGVDGAGAEKGPSLLGVGRTLKPAGIQAQILHGGDAMPPFADALAPEEVRALVEYLSAKKKVIRGKGAAVAPAKPAPKPNTGGSDDSNDQ